MIDCATCKFWMNLSGEGSGGTGQCRRRAPIVTGGMMSGVETVWPITGEAEWCGEHEAGYAFEGVEEAPTFTPRCAECEDGMVAPKKEWPPINRANSSCPKCGELCIPF